MKVYPPNGYTKVYLLKTNTKQLLEIKQNKAQIYIKNHELVI